jgi:hypothetical protein
MKENLQNNPPPNPRSSPHMNLLSPINGGPFGNPRSKPIKNEQISESEEYQFEIQRDYVDYKPDPSQDTFGVREKNSQKIDSSNFQSSFNLPRSTNTNDRKKNIVKDQATQMSHKNLPPAPNLDDSLEYFRSKYAIDKRKIKKIYKNRKKKGTPIKAPIQKEKIIGEVKPLEVMKKSIKKLELKKKPIRKFNMDTLINKDIKKKKKRLNFIDEKTKSICEKYSQRDISVDSNSNSLKKPTKKFENLKKFQSTRETPYLEFPYESEMTIEEKMERKYSKNYKSSSFKHMPKIELKNGARFSNIKKSSNKIKNEIFDCYYKQSKPVSRSKSPLRDCLLNFKSSFAAIDPSQRNDKVSLKQSIQSQRTKSSKPQTQSTFKAKQLKFGQNRVNRYLSPSHNMKRSFTPLRRKNSLSPDPLCTPKKVSKKISGKIPIQVNINQNQMTPKSHQNSFRNYHSPIRNKFSIPNRYQETRITFKKNSPASIKKQLKDFLKSKNKIGSTENKNKYNIISGNAVTSQGPWSVNDNPTLDSRGKYRKDRGSRPGTNEILGEYDLIVNKVIKGSEIYKKKRILEKQLEDFEKYKKNIESLLKDIKK